MDTLTHHPIPHTPSLNDSRPPFLPNNSNITSFGAQPPSLAPMMFPPSPNNVKKSPFLFVRPRSPAPTFCFANMPISPESHQTLGMACHPRPQFMQVSSNGSAQGPPPNQHQIAMTPRLKDISVQLPQFFSMPSNPTPPFGNIADSPIGYTPVFQQTDFSHTGTPAYVMNGDMNIPKTNFPGNTANINPGMGHAQGSFENEGIYPRPHFLNMETGPFPNQRGRPVKGVQNPVTNLPVDVLTRIANDPYPIKGESCRHYEKGHCNFGVHCKFGHDESKQMAPDGRFLCRHWIKGFCQMGSGCSFSHAVAIPQTSDGKYRCWHWRRGSCQMGQNCKFSHEGNPGMTPISNIINDSEANPTNRASCWHFRNGKCEMASCKFSHDNERGEEGVTNSSRYRYSSEECYTDTLGESGVCETDTSSEQFESNIRDCKNGDDSNTRTNE